MTMRQGTAAECARTCLAVLLLAGCATAPTPDEWRLGRDADPGLRSLSVSLKRMLEGGTLPAVILSGTNGAAFASAEYGVTADYRAWRSNLRAYNHRLENSQQYRPLPILAALKDDPLDAAWLADSWMRQTVGTGSHSVFDTVDRLCDAFGDTNQPLHTTHDAKAAGTPLECFVQVFTNSASVVDRQALARIPPSDRELLAFVVPWVCRVQECFTNASKGAPYYGFHMVYEPPDPFKPGDRTTAAGMPVPPRLYSQTGLYHFLRALAGQPLQTTGIVADWDAKASHPSFTASIDFRAMQSAWRALAPTLAPSALDRLRAALLQLSPASAPAVPGTTGRMLAAIQTPYGLVVVGGPDANTYSNVDAAVILDLGGNDTYVFDNPQRDIGRYPVSILVDFAGDDVYLTHGVGGPAAGILGISVLIDRAGNDVYAQGLSPAFDPRHANRASLLQSDPETSKTQLVPPEMLYGNSQSPGRPGVPLDCGFAFGAGFLGIGCLIDEAGDDLYLGQKFAFGAAMWHGVGVLSDAAGDDVYAAGIAAEGAAVNFSFALLEDRAGNDHYQCLGLHESGYSAGAEWDNGYEGGGIGFGSCWRGEVRQEDPKHRWAATADGGVGMVHDLGGDDEYVGGSFSIASGYAGGAGILVDDSGNDTYFVKRGPGGSNRSGWSGDHSLGNGCHRGIGYLLDRAGNDRYSAGNLGGGTAWDLGIGYLLDLGGDDWMTDLYGTHEAGSTGWGAAKALAVSYHAGGTDRYERGTFGNAQVIGEGYPGVGGNFSFFFDIGPESDVYPSGYSNNTIRCGGVFMSKEPDGHEYPAGIGLFVDGVLP